MIFYDFEVFRYDWLVVLIDLNARKETVIINDPDKLKRFYEEHKGVIWAGYNSRNYDQYILKAILCGFDPKPVNDWIIAEAKPGYRYSSLFREYPLINYDVMPNPPISLKALEAFMRKTTTPLLGSSMKWALTGLKMKPPIPCIAGIRNIALQTTSKPFPRLSFPDRSQNAVASQRFPSGSETGKPVYL